MGNSCKMGRIDTAIKQYEEIAAMRRPSDHQQNMVSSFMKSESLGGNCQFLGRDLGDEPQFPSVFSGPSKHDLIFLGEDTGEDDLLSRLLKGPGMRMFHRVWKPLKVRISSWLPLDSDESMLVTIASRSLRAWEVRAPGGTASFHTCAITLTGN